MQVPDKMSQKLLAVAGKLVAQKEAVKDKVVVFLLLCLTGNEILRRKMMNLNLYRRPLAIYKWLFGGEKNRKQNIRYNIK